MTSKAARPVRLRRAIEPASFQGHRAGSRQLFAIDASTLKGAGFTALQQTVQAGDGVVLRSNTRDLAIIVAPSSEPEKAKEARLKETLTEFRANPYDFGRLALFMQEPVLIVEGDVPCLLLLPRISGNWSRRTEVLRTSQAPTTQIVLPPILPEVHIQLAERIGDHIGDRIADSVRQLTDVFRSFTREAALAAAGGSNDEDAD